MRGTRVLLRTLLSLHPEIEVVGEAENGEEAARLAVSAAADIALLDIEMPRMDGLTAAELIMSVRPQARVILHAASADEKKTGTSSGARPDAARQGRLRRDDRRGHRAPAGSEARQPPPRGTRGPRSFRAR